MTYLQSTLEEIADSEKAMILTAEERYGAYFLHARTCSIFLSRCIVGIDQSRVMFGNIFAHLKKHHILALLSTLRLHKVQSMMDLRQVLEAGASAAYAIANPDHTHFVDTDENGILDPAQDLTRKRYRWLDENYARKSSTIKIRKEQINKAAAHANIVSGDSVFRISGDGSWASAPFFDIEEEYFVRTDL